MQEPELTPWFPSSVNPRKTGVYQRMDEHSKIYYSKYTHAGWCWLAFTADVAESSNAVSQFQSLPWRGLCKNPN